VGACLHHKVQDLTERRVEEMKAKGGGNKRGDVGQTALRG
jgi:hypothetical protein